MPASVTKRKDNSRKHPNEREKWMKAKRAGRPKQVWVWDNIIAATGHWERVA